MGSTLREIMARRCPVFPRRILQLAICICFITLLCKAVEIYLKQSFYVRANQKRGSYVRLRNYPEYSGLYKLPKDSVHVRANGNFTYKISRYNDAINALRKKLYNDTKRLVTAAKKRVLIAGNQQEYLRKLADVPAVTGVFLDWTDRAGRGASGEWTSLLDRSNLLVQDYFPWIGSVAFCHLMQRSRFSRHRWDTIYNKQCTTDLSRTLNRTSIELFVLNSIQINKDYYFPNNGNRFPEQMYADLPKFMTYMHVIQDGVVTVNGEVYTNEIKIAPYNCHPELKITSPEPSFRDVPFVSEVFSISQYWGSGFFHKMLEDYPKMALYLQFLKSNPQIRIQVAEKGNYTVYIMQLLGIASDRLVVGNVRSHLIYLPRGTSCGFTQVPEAQLLSRLIRDAINPTKSAANVRHSLILVRRSGRRQFSENAALAERLDKLAKEFQLDFFLFKDNPLPPVNETLQVFNRAAMVIAPHGAGLSNLLYVEPGTYVIEGLCNPPHTNMCYTRLSYILGLHYHALISPKGCEQQVRIPAVEVEQTARRYLQQLREVKGS